MGLHPCTGHGFTWNPVGSHWMAWNYMESNEISCGVMRASRKTVEPNVTSLDDMEFHGFQWGCMEVHGIQRDPLGYHGCTWTPIKVRRASCHSMESHWMAWMFMQRNGITLDSIMHGAPRSFMESTGITSYDIIQWNFIGSHGIIDVSIQLPARAGSFMERVNLYYMGTWVLTHNIETISCSSPPRCS